MKKVKKNERFLQKNGTFSADYLVVLRKSSTFACFFAERECARTRCAKRERGKVKTER